MGNKIPEQTPSSKTFRKQVLANKFFRMDILFDQIEIVGATHCWHFVKFKVVAKAFGKYGERNVVSKITGFPQN